MAIGLDGTLVQGKAGLCMIASRVQNFIALANAVAV